ncbi:MAG: acetoacetate decarboxylase family protein [Actinomycetota bacterium]|nr:acetoacetate decarboxylase family protein [Actinomycetota bacterium]
MTISNLPEYIDRGSEQVWRPPASATDIDLYGLVIPADDGAIDAMLAHDLNLPSGNAVDYRCANPNVIITFGSIGHEASSDPVDSGRGFISENEVSVWCLAADMNASGRLVWYLPYIFTDSQQTVSTGREIFGYPKQLGYFDAGYPAALDDAGGVTTVSGLAIDPFGPASPATKREMLSVTRQPGAAAVLGAPSLFGALGAVVPGGVSVNLSIPSGPGSAPSATITASGSVPPAIPQAATPWIKGFVNAFKAPKGLLDSDSLILDMVKNTTLVFLKQFRDITCPTKACYQAVVEAPITFHLTGLGYQQLDPSVFALTVQSWASDPIAAQLGIAPRTPIAPASAFQAKLGFEIGLGLEIWRAPT